MIKHETIIDNSENLTLLSYNNLQEQVILATFLIKDNEGIIKNDEGITDDSEEEVVEYDSEIIEHFDIENIVFLKDKIL
ncbi:3569_t:CDS:2 [Gigaspora margarita]|uniref:3569_t:CDS:1 n=1 Tax=Gigaspora margarita TaxID=4874 RepID=A0ABN7UC78_GIGMA|nr:3569_t:CDS:2 [Gigaspora margarita]